MTDHILDSSPGHSFEPGGRVCGAPFPLAFDFDNDQMDVSRSRPGRISPPPWAKVPLASPLYTSHEPDQEDIYNLCTNNPFKRELFKSIIGNETNILNVLRAVSSVQCQSLHPVTNTSSNCCALNKKSFIKLENTKYFSDKLCRKFSEKLSRQRTGYHNYSDLYTSSLERFYNNAEHCSKSVLPNCNSLNKYFVKRIYGTNKILPSIYRKSKVRLNSKSFKIKSDDLSNLKVKPMKHYSKGNNVQNKHIKNIFSTKTYNENFDKKRTGKCEKAFPVSFNLWKTVDESSLEHIVKSISPSSEETKSESSDGSLQDECTTKYPHNTSDYSKPLITWCDSGIGMELVEEDFESWDMTSEIEMSDEDRGDHKEVLCGNRVSQMTRTYHDIEAVTRLLQEKEKDLELAARIGQQLLSRNKALEEKNSNLESELCSSSEKITQLKHDLLMKTDLLQIYTNDFDDSSVESTPTGLRHINIDLLQRRVKSLENENVHLLEEASQIANDTQYCEDKEKELVNDVIKQLNDANLQVNQMSDELSKKIEDNLRQQEEITQLLAQVVDLQSTNRRLTRDNDDLVSLVGVARECQQELTTELAELKEKYAEVLDLLHDTQEQLRRYQKKNVPGNRSSHLGGSLFSSLHSGTDSIASELHSLSSGGEETTERVDGAKSLSRVFDTVRLSSKLRGSSMSPMGFSEGSVYSTPTKQASQTQSHLNTPMHMGGRYSPYFGGSGMSMGCSSGVPSLDSGAESDGSFPTDSEDNYPASRSGVPGWPGTPDLDSCVRRLGPHDRNPYLPYGCRTPDSIMSTGSIKSGMSGYSGQDWKLPQKLQIVKPIEGSLTLHQWSRLATPHLGGLLEEREGIAMKGATNADLNLELYSMSDLEEEEEDEEDEETREGKDYPGKQFMYTSGVYTYTNSTVLHPDDVTNLTPSLRPTHMSALPSSVAASLPPTPSHGPSQPSSRRGSTATFSTNVGIAKHLHERGFGGALRESSGQHYTATPANSPEGTRPGSPEPSAYKLPGLDDLTKHFHAGASFIRRTIYGRTDPSNPSSPPDSKINIVERVQALGVGRLVCQSGYPQSVGGVVTSRPQSTPPLLHLSNLIRSGAKSASTEEPSLGITSTISTKGSIMSTPKITSPGERRPQLPSGSPLGIPGHPGAGHLNSRLTQLKPGQRADLGTVGCVGSRPRPSTLGKIPLGKKDEKIGTIGWTSLGRKGGLL